MRFLRALKGSIKINNNKKFNIDAWQTNIAYVPQKIYLADEMLNLMLRLKTICSDDEEKNFKNALKLVEMYDYFKSLPNNLTL